MHAYLKVIILRNCNFLKGRANLLKIKNRIDKFHVEKVFFFFLMC